MASSNRAKIPGFVLSIDPGKKTGIAFVDCTGSEPELMWSVEADEDQVANAIRPVLDWSASPVGAKPPPTSIVIERFTITAATAKNSQAPFSLEVIGLVKQCMRDVSIPVESIIWQSPADAKKICSNAQLKALNLWHVGGEGHALDALRHVVLAILRSGYKDSRLLSA